MSIKPRDIPEDDLILKVSTKIKNAREQSQKFELTFKQIQTMFKGQSYCAYSGAAFIAIGDITFERINPRLPYRKGNVVLVTKYINDLKGQTIDTFIHQSGMPLDAMADLFALMARELRKEFNAIQDEKIKEIKALEADVEVDSEPENVVNGAPKEGAKLLMQMFKAAKENKKVPDETPTPRSRG